ncbi:hypothetical protein CBS101457_006509 [Exobasidium rhododendri]|nr:hypothetical protein CBS101457_006509 [Exobasidium rhododendri]
METRELRGGLPAASIGPLYIIYFSGNHTNFRLAEFRAGADYLDIAYSFVPLPYVGIPWLDGVPEEDKVWREAIDLSLYNEEAEKGINTERPFMLVYLPSDEVASLLCKRVTSIKSVWQLWASGRNAEELKMDLRKDQVKELWWPFCDKEISWRATVLSYQRSLTMPEQISRIELFKEVLNFQGPIKMKGADLEWGYMEEWTAPCLLPVEVEEGTKEIFDMSRYVVESKVDRETKKRFQRQRLLSMHIGRKVSDGNARELISRMDVKRRKYIGNTTMESQMSLIQAGMALSGPGKIIYDPFAGTCSLLLAAAVLGGHVMASDIDGRMMRGKAKKCQEVAVLGSARQYGVKDQFIDFICSDVSQHPWRGEGLFDAIVADPPYGVRAGAKQLGRRDLNKQRDTPFVLSDGTYSHHQQDYLPPMKPYALNDLLIDLMNFSAKLLKAKGRLVFWMPTMIECEEDTDGATGGSSMQALQLELTQDFVLLSHSLQDFGAWGRRLITLEKVPKKSHEKKEVAVLPLAPIKHHGLDARLRATDDPNEFRNRFFSRQIESTSSAQLVPTDKDSRR